jgi:ParB-like chromosome segregation protein Spo0J
VPHALSFVDPASFPVKTEGVSMTVDTLPPANKPSERTKPLAVNFDTKLIVVPPGYPEPKRAVMDALLPSIRVHGQMVPGFVGRSSSLPDNQRVLIEGIHRFEADKILGLPFYAFDLDREYSHAERITLTMQLNHVRRIMSREEIASLASIFMEETGCTAAQASGRLLVSPATLSRAFGDARIPEEWKQAAGQLAPTIRSLIAAVPPSLMGRAVDFALTEVDGKRPTRDAVGLFIRQLRKDGQGKVGKAKVIALRINGRLVTVKLAEGDAAASVVKDLQAIATRLSSKELANVSPDGWPFLFA